MIICLKSTKRLGYTLYTVSKERNTEETYKRQTGAIPDLSSMAGLPRAAAVSWNRVTTELVCMGLCEVQEWKGVLKVLDTQR